MGRFLERFLSGSSVDERFHNNSVGVLNGFAAKVLENRKSCFDAHQRDRFRPKSPEKIVRRCVGHDRCFKIDVCSLCSRSLLNNLIYIKKR